MTPSTPCLGALQQILGYFPPENNLSVEAPVSRAPACGDSGRDLVPQRDAIVSSFIPAAFQKEKPISARVAWLRAGFEWHGGSSGIQKHQVAAVPERESFPEPSRATRAVIPACVP